MERWTDDWMGGREASRKDEWMALKQLWCPQEAAQMKEPDHSVSLAQDIL